MKRSVLLLFIAVVISSGLAPGQAKKGASKEMSLGGEVVDVACYLAEGARGEGHIACATACAKASGALGILTVDGKLYVSLLPDDHKNNPNHLLMDHIGHTVGARGLVRSKGA